MNLREKEDLNMLACLLLRTFKFKLYARCACPGKCSSSQNECKAKDLCSCEMSDGTGTINL